MRTIQLVVLWTAAALIAMNLVNVITADLRLTAQTHGYFPFLQDHR